MTYFIKPPTYKLGLDFGYERDYSTVVVLEYSVFQNGKHDPTNWQWIHEHRFHIRHIERIPLKTDYTAVADYIRDFVTHPALLHNTEVVLDCSGVGRAVYSIFLTRSIAAKLRPVQFTSGDNVRQVDDKWHIPRSVLLTNLHTMFANRHIKIGRRVPHAPELLDELHSLQMRISRAGNDSIQPALSTGHDDLAIAAALAAFFPSHNNPAIYPRMKGTHPNLANSPY